MTGTAQALFSFFSSFGIPAYAQTNIPDEAEAPYITFRQVEAEPLAQTPLEAWVWYRGTTYVEVAATVDQIKAAIGTGVMIPTSSGHIVLYLDTPFAQIQPDPNPDIKCAYLRMILQCDTI